MAFDLKKFATDCGVPEPDRFADAVGHLRELVVETNHSMNLTRIVELEDFLIKHIADSLVIAKFFPEFTQESLRIADIGCGAGFPSLVLALAFPQLQLVPIDSTGKKVDFVARATQSLGLRNVSVVKGRSCELNRKTQFQYQFDVVTARAVAPSPIIYGDADKFPKHRSGRFILYKTPDQLVKELPALKILCAKQSIGWRATEIFQLPENAGTRQFLYSFRE